MWLAISLLQKFLSRLNLAARKRYAKHFTCTPDGLSRRAVSAEPHQTTEVKNDEVVYSSLQTVIGRDNGQTVFGDVMQNIKVDATYSSEEAMCVT